MRLKLVAALMLLSLSLVVAPTPQQNHPLSEIYPIDTDLDMNNSNILDIEQLALSNGLFMQGNNIMASSGTTALSLSNSGNVQVPSGNLQVSGTTDGVDLDNPANSINLTGNQYAVNWNAANDLNSNGGISDFSNAADLGTGGDILNGNVENAELANSALTVAGNTVSLGGSTGIGHGDLNGISYNDHHGVGDDLNWDSNNDPRLSNNVEVTGKMVIPVGTDAGL